MHGETAYAAVLVALIVRVADLAVTSIRHDLE